MFNVKQDVSPENLEEDNTSCVGRKRRRAPFEKRGVLSGHLTGSNEEDKFRSYDTVPKMKWQKQQGIIKKLEAKLKEFEEKAARDEEEAVKNKVQLKKLSELDLKCTICMEMIKNPQVLQCGHTACYLCLRKWWTSPNNEQGDAENEGTWANVDQPGALSTNPAPEPRPHIYYRFSSVVDRQKYCPYCHVVIQLRPAPEYRLYDILETMTGHLPPLPWHVHHAHANNRQDIWHGIFHPEPLNARPADQTRMMQLLVEQVRRSEEERQRLLEHNIRNAYMEGRRRGMAEIQRRCWDNMDEVIRAELAVPINGTDYFHSEDQVPQVFAAPQTPGANTAAIQGFAVNPVSSPAHQDVPVVAPRPNVPIVAHRLLQAAPAVAPPHHHGAPAL